MSISKHKSTAGQYISKFAIKERGVLDVLDRFYMDSVVDHSSGGTDHHELDKHGEGVWLHVHARGISEVIV